MFHMNAVDSETPCDVVRWLQREAAVLDHQKDMTEQVRCD
jgi:hypothetical protein